MAVESTQQMSPEQVEPTPVERWRFTVDDFQRMGELGIFGEEPRAELIDGEIYRMNPIGAGHSGRVIRFTRIFTSMLGDRALVSLQNPLQIRPRHQPQPDVILLRPREDDYTTSHPTAPDVLLIVEVADSPLGYDRGTKAPVYAQAGIADYWIVDLTHAQVLVLRKPVDEAYQSVETLVAGDSLHPLAFPDVTVSVAEILA
jgi:Uma2 family endonuclease